ncbi:MAG: hydantoinase/oxoprolinase family protein [Hyphomicrobiales bacterium]|nr:hydantoinase/oxoprolinase family protein [Hyphomicrobiales bacterium]MCP5370796.1 hydantoinase/oxoprolinase family protein [Hyphomicrobiales bacterium]
MPVANAPSPQFPTWYIGVDCGGTFTDLVLAGSDHQVHVFKVPSVPGDPAQGVLRVLDRAAEALETTVEALLGNCALFMHGSTVATNTVLEGKGARVGLLTSAGFRDSLQIRRGYRENPFDHRTPFPPVLVPRHARLPVGGRIDRDGHEIEPLDEAAVAEAARTLAAAGVEAVAVCLFNSFLNPAHERRALEILAAAWPEGPAFASVDIAPILGEYERGSTVVMNAYVAPRTVGYIRRLDDRLRELGLPRSMLLIQNNGGAVSVEQLATKPATLLLSGPAAGVGALEFHRRAAGTDNLISMEIGGTSCDVILMSGGRVDVSDSIRVGGYDLSVPSVDIFTIGAGGGTIAGVDPAGLLFAGPAGAGADPGPAAYGLGGTEPTVTDAQLVLGRLRPGPYAGGSVSLDLDLARAALESRVAAPLGIPVEDAAAGVIRLVEQNLLQAVQEISSERGHDPRRFTLVAAGGAGPMHGAPVGRLLGCPRVYVPRLSGVFCALGMLHTNVRHDFVRVHMQPLAEADPAAVEALYGELEAEGRRALAAGGFAAEDQVLLREMDLRYVGQQYDLRVALGSGGGLDGAAIRAAFEREHDRLFGHTQPEGAISINKLRLVAVGALRPLELPPAAPARAAPTPVDRRRVWLSEADGWADVDTYRGADLRAGHTLAGPALVEEQTTTVLVGPHDTLEVDSANNFRIDLAASGA